MGKGIKTLGAAPDIERVSLGELIHEHVRVANGQIKSRRIDGWQKIATVLSRQVAA